MESVEPAASLASEMIKQRRDKAYHQPGVVDR
jgi:hypothetical protein